MTTWLEGLVPYLYEDAYHAHPALSSTGARTLLRSPAKFEHERTHPRADTKALDVGSAAHAKVLGIGSGIVTYPPEHLTPSGNISTKAATTAWAAAQRAEGLTPVSPNDVAAIDAMAEAVLAHRTGRRLLEAAGQSEVSVFWTDPDTGVECRARFDRLPDPAAITAGGAPIGLDLKTARDASPSGFRRAVAEHGYHVQQEFYRDGYETVTGIRPAFMFVAVEKEPPYLVAVHQLDAEARTIGQRRAAFARQIYRDCTEAGVWPGYSDDITLISLPKYALTPEMDT
jgi:hypothetical protein